MKNRVTWGTGHRLFGFHDCIGFSGFMGSRVAGSSSWIPQELLNRRISVPVADHRGSGPHGYSGLRTRVWQLLGSPSLFRLWASRKSIGFRRISNRGANHGGSDLPWVVGTPVLPPSVSSLTLPISSLGLSL
jgi:hypothetical protein